MQKPGSFRIKIVIKIKKHRASAEKRKRECARRSAYYSISSNSDSGISGAGTPQQLFSAASGGILIRSGDMCGARRKFPKEVSSERKFSFLSDFLPVSRRLARKSAARKNDSSFFRCAATVSPHKKTALPCSRAILVYAL